MQFYSPPPKAPVKSALRHSSYNVGANTDDLSSTDDSDASPGLQHTLSSPIPTSTSVPKNLRVSLNVENNSPSSISPKSSPYDTNSLSLKKSTSTPQIPSSTRVAFGRDSSDSNVSSFSSGSLSKSVSDAESPALERSNSLVILDDFPQEVSFI